MEGAAAAQDGAKYSGPADVALWLPVSSDARQPPGRARSTSRCSSREQTGERQSAARQALAQHSAAWGIEAVRLLGAVPAVATVPRRARSRIKMRQPIIFYFRSFPLASPSCPLARPTTRARASSPAQPSPRTPPAALPSSFRSGPRSFLHALEPDLPVAASVPSHHAVTGQP